MRGRLQRLPPPAPRCETAETVRRVLAMREVGTDATTISRDVGISKTRVYGILGENLVGVYAPGESEED